MTYRLVVDTNLIISAFLWGGPPRNLLNQIITREILLLTSAEMIAEIDVTLRKPKFDTRFKAQGRTIDAIMDEYCRITKLITPADIPENTVRDPKDHYNPGSSSGWNCFTPYQW